MRRLLCFLLVLVLLMPLCITAKAHPGKTDSNGGHRDRSTGEYHYHHGYSAHDHYDMDGDGIIDCPYDFVDKTRNSNSSYTSDSRSTSSVNTPTTFTTPTEQPKHENAENESVSVKEEKKMPTWGYWVIGILGCVAVIQHLIIRSMSKDIDSHRETIRENLKKNDQLKSDIETLKKENLRIANSEEDWKRQVNQIKSNSDTVIRLKDSRIAALTRKVELIQNEKDELYQRYPFAKTGPTSQLLTHPINLPNDVYFIRGKVPVKGTVNEDRPFGDFTVFITQRGKKYHSNKYCGSVIFSTPAHVYDILNDHAPCTRCATSLPFRPKQIPEWYTEVKKLAETL